MNDEDDDFFPFNPPVPPGDDSGALLEASEVSACFAPVVDGEEESSSVASDDDAPASFPDKGFSTFDDLRSSVLAFARLAPVHISDNSRCATKVENLPTQWLRKMFPIVQGSVKYSGFFYCRINHSCEWKVHYKLLQNGCWTVVSQNTVWIHNHELSMLSQNVPAASGLVHLKRVQDLSVQHKTAIISLLEAGLTIKLIRFKFRAKFPGYELRARCCKTIKEAYLKEKYGADRHQMSMFIQQLNRDCNPDCGGVCDITYFENMEIAEVYFQMPLLRQVGQYFGNFSVIDMSHNMSMYERHMASYNVSIKLM
jgi:hypothetical protein